jgi:hypothetical protein
MGLNAVSLEKPNQERLHKISGQHISEMLSADGRRNRAGERMNRVLFKGFYKPDEVPVVAEDISVEDERSYAVIMGFLGLAQMVTCIGQCQFYFRRFPFRGLNVSRSDHLRNCCEMYFDRVIQYRDRLKRSLNLCKEEGAVDSPEVSRILKIFDRAFSWEHRQRNQTHHHDRFDYEELNQLGLAEMIGKTLPDEVQWMLNPQRLYRKAANQWVERIQSRVEALDRLTEHVVGIMLECPSIVRLVPIVATEPIPPLTSGQSSQRAGAAGWILED